MPNNEQELRLQLLDCVQQFQSSGLSVGKSGNASSRCKDGYLITPSGVDYQDMHADNLVLLDQQAQYESGILKPSSEWQFHIDIYRSRPEVQAIVHCHSTYCTALACTGRAIPAFHYMVAIAGGIDIPIAPYALFGTPQLSEYVVKTVKNRFACLMANHGMIALGTTVNQAFNLALEVENLAQQYYLALQLGDIQILSETQMTEALEKFKTYGQRL